MSGDRIQTVENSWKVIGTGLGIALGITLGITLDNLLEDQNVKGCYI